MVKVLVVLVFCVFLFLIYKLLVGRNIETVEELLPIKTGREGDDRKINKTGTFSDWNICELDDNGSIIQEVPLDQKKCESEEGFSIGRSKSCDFVIKRKSIFVGGVHARIGHDKEGFFVMDNDSQNHMFTQGRTVESFALCDKVLYLADTPIWFRKNEHNFLVDTPIEKAGEDPKQASLEKPPVDSPYKKPLRR